MYVLLYKVTPQSKWLAYSELFRERISADSFGRGSMGRGVWCKIHVVYVEMP